MKTIAPLCVFVLLVSTLFAQRPGDLVKSFGGGKMMTDQDSLNGFTEVVVQPDGKIIAVGYFKRNPAQPISGYKTALLRYNINGHRDRTFGTEGMVRINTVLENFFIFSIALQGDGKILVAGRLANDGMAVIRLHANGTVDNTFNKVQVRHLRSCDEVLLAQQKDGDIILAGTFEERGIEAFGEYYQNHYNAFNDSALNHNLRNENAADAMGRALAYKEWCRLRAVNQQRALVVLRLNSDGAIEQRTEVALHKDENPVYSENLMRYLHLHEHARGIGIQPDDKIIIATELLPLTYTDTFKFFRFDADGNIDPSFGTNGVLIMSSRGGTFAPSVMAVQDDGKIILCGHPENIFDKRESKINTVRYNADGSLDAGFGENGKVQTTFEQISSMSGVLPQPDGKIVLTGYQGFPTDFFVMRLNYDGSRDNSFGNMGIVYTDFNGGNEHAATGAMQQNGDIVVSGFSVTKSGKQYVRYATLARYHGDSGAQLPGTSIDDENITITSPMLSESLMQFTLNEPGNVTIQLFDINGRLVMTIANNEQRNAGTYNETVHIDEALPSGRYLLSLTTSGKTSSTWVVKQ